jgi:hypothetical protein
MARSLTVVASLLVLTACAGIGPSTEVAGYSSLDGRHRASLSADSNCGSKTQGGLNPKKGGTIVIPTVPSSGNFGGYAQYAPLTSKVYETSGFVSCSYNAYNIPVPQGYTPDWFGQWDVCNGTCAFSFETATLKMQVKSATWVPKKTYYLFVYTTTGGALMTSYPIGVVKKKKETLTFPTPFENGLTWPPNDTISLEIVHAT